MVCGIRRKPRIKEPRKQASYGGQDCYNNLVYKWDTRDVTWWICLILTVYISLCSGSSCKASRPFFPMQVIHVPPLKMYSECRLEQLSRSLVLNYNRMVHQEDIQCSWAVWLVFVFTPNS